MAVRAMWKGDISFGLVSIPIALVPVEESKTDLHFHLLDAKDQSRVRYKRVNTNTGKEVPWEQIVKGYEYDKDSYIVVDESAFEKASPDLFKSITIEEFVDISEVDSLYFEKPYFILPDSKNKKAYVLLREALKKSKKVGVARVILRTKEYLCLIMPHSDALILNLLHFKEALRDESELNLPHEDLKTYKINERELKMAISLIKDMEAKWEPEKYHDDYSDALRKWLDKKTEEALKKAGKTTRKKMAQAQSSDVVDFIALLKQSMKKKAAVSAEGRKKTGTKKK